MQSLIDVKEQNSAEKLNSEYCFCQELWDYYFYLGCTHPDGQSVSGLVRTIHTQYELEKRIRFVIKFPLLTCKLTSELSWCTKHYLSVFRPNAGKTNTFLTYIFFGKHYWQCNSACVTVCLSACVGGVSRFLLFALLETAAEDVNLSSAELPQLLSIHHGLCWWVLFCLCCAVEQQVDAISQQVPLSRTQWENYLS